MIGRLYYASFLEARDSAGVKFGSTEVHKAVIEHWGKKDSRTANSLRNLRRCRNEADYDIHLDITPDSVSIARRHARMVLKLFKVYI